MRRRVAKCETAELELTCARRRVLQDSRRLARKSLGPVHSGIKVSYRSCTITPVLLPSSRQSVAAWTHLSQLRLPQKAHDLELAGWSHCEGQQQGYTEVHNWLGMDSVRTRETRSFRYLRGAGARSSASQWNDQDPPRSRTSRLTYSSLSTVLRQSQTTPFAPASTSELLAQFTPTLPHSRTSSPRRCLTPFPPLGPHQRSP